MPRIRCRPRLTEPTMPRIYRRSRGTASCGGKLPAPVAGRNLPAPVAGKNLPAPRLV
jgi:hypothetical protein